MGHQPIRFRPSGHPGRQPSREPLGGTARSAADPVTIFEYISVAFSIVLALGAASLLRALPSVFSPGRRYWIHATWVVSLLFLHALAWWSLWSYSGVESWTLLTFLLVLLQPGLLYLDTSLLVGEAPESSVSGTCASVSASAI